MVRFVNLLSLVASASAASCAVTQQVNGSTYITQGPKHEANWHDYWFTTSRTALHTLKTLLGPQGLKDLLKPEIAKADAFWLDIVGRSSNETWKAAEGHTIAYLPNVTAAAFAGWFSSPLADAANNDANAEHYFKQTVADPATGSISSEIIEGWGGVTTHFTVPNFAFANTTRYPMIKKLPTFPIQFAGEKTLMDGTVFGILHIAVRDIAAGDHPQYESEYGAKGIEVYAAVWYGDASDDEHLETERQHMIIEEINLTQQCQLDIVSGRFPIKPSS